MAERVISASDFKNQCAKVVDEVERNRTTVVVTRRGQPVAKLVPVDVETAPLFGFAENTVTTHGNVVEPVDVEWEAAG